MFSIYCSGTMASLNDIHVVGSFLVA